MTLVCENPMNYITEFCIGNGSQLETCVTTFFSHGHGHGHELLGHGHGHGHELFGHGHGHGNDHSHKNSIKKSVILNHLRF